MKVDFLEKIWKENRSCWTQANENIMLLGNYELDFM